LKPLVFPARSKEFDKANASAKDVGAIAIRLLVSARRELDEAILSINEVCPLRSAANLEDCGRKVKDAWNCVVMMAEHIKEAEKSL
jgi:hypothetical protein